MGMGFRSTLLERQGSAVEVGLLPAFPYYRERKENKNKTSGQPRQEKTLRGHPSNQRKPKGSCSPSARHMQLLQEQALNPCCVPGTVPGAEAAGMTSEPPRSSQSEFSNGVCTVRKKSHYIRKKEGQGMKEPAGNKS